MEKTMAERYKKETGKVPYDSVYQDFPSGDYIEWLETRLEKAEELFRKAQDLTDFVRRNKNKKIEELEIDLQIAITRANALQNAFNGLLAKKLTDEELDSPPASKILKEMAEKAEAYDRLMSGGKKTLKEWANILGRVVVINGNGIAESFAGTPTIDLRYCFWYIDEDDDDYEDDRFIIPKECVDFDGDWKNSLTLPDGWEEA